MTDAHLNLAASLASTGPCVAPQAENQKEKDRLYMLDGMRGLAALAVLLFHVGLTVGLPLFRAGDLAVDFFFGLSGYVVASAYQNRLCCGLSPFSFMRARVIRLYPMIILGTVFGSIKMVGQIAKHDNNALSVPKFLISIMSNLSALPLPIGSIFLFPLNGPMWSLFLEIVINLVFAALLFRISDRKIMFLGVCAAVVMAVDAVHSGIANAGPEWSRLPAGFARVTFSFCAGMLLFRWRTARRKTSWPVTMTVFAALTAVLSIPSLLGPWQIAYDLTAIFVIMPLLLLIGSSINVTGLFAHVCAFLGDISYPMYVIHFPLMGIGWFVASRMHVGPTAFASLFTIAIVIFSALLVRFYDMPIRTAITRRWQVHRTPPAMAR